MTTSLEMSFKKGALTTLSYWSRQHIMLSTDIPGFLLIGKIFTCCAPSACASSNPDD